MKKILLICLVLSSVLMIRYVYVFKSNETFILNYNNGKIDDDELIPLFYANIYQPCIVHYNYGNVLFKSEKYNEAIDEYTKALELFPCKTQECKIRINLALAKLRLIDEHDNSEDNLNKILNILQSARDVLCEKGCANKYDDNGHSEEAEKLKKEIDEKIKELNKEDNDAEEKKEENKKQEETKEQENNEEKLKEIQKKVTEERKEYFEKSQTLKDYKFYNGKKW